VWPSTSAGSPDPDPDPNPNPNPDPDPSPNPNPNPSPNLSTGSPVRPPSPCRSWWSWCSAWRRGLRRRLRTLDSTTGTMTTRTPTIATRRQTIAPSPCSSTTGSEAMWKAAAQRLRPNRPPARPASAGPGPGRPPASASLGQPRPASADTLADMFWLALAPPALSSTQVLGCRLPQGLLSRRAAAADQSSPRRADAPAVHAPLDPAPRAAARRRRRRRRRRRSGSRRAARSHRAGFERLAGRAA